MSCANSTKSTTRFWTLPVLVIFAASLLASRPARAQITSATDHAPAPVNLADTALGRSRTPSQVTNGTAKLIGPYDRAAKLHVVLGLTRPKMAEEETFLQQLQDKNSPNFHKYLTAEQWNARFSPSAKNEQAVVDWATSNGLTVTKRFANRLIVDVEGIPEAFEQAFAVQINSYQLGAEVDYSNDRDPVIPAHLINILQSVDGMNSIQRVHSAHERIVSPKSPIDASSLLTPQHADGNQAAYQEAMKAAAARRIESTTDRKSAIGAENGLQPEITNGYIDPTDIYSSYGYDYGALQNQGHCCNPTHNSTGSTPTTTIAIATSGDFANSDITGFVTQYPYLAYYYNRDYIDGTAACCGDETTLDTEWAIATSNSFGSYLDTSFVWVYIAVNANLSTFTDMFNYMLSDGRARVFSTSWGCGENDCYGSGTMNTDHGIFNSMVGQGWTLLAASGDNGAATDCGNADRVTYPASDPDVIAVGGTSLEFYSNGVFDSETAWQGGFGTGSCAANGGGSGGGCSAYFGAPGYQNYSPYNEYPYCGSGSRSVPDIALNAGYGQNYYFDGGLHGVGGTSIATPQAAGFMAQEDSYLLAIGVGCGAGYAYACAPMGEVQYQLYYVGSNRNYARHYPYYDILLDCNDNDITVKYGLGYYCAGTGYDAITGWGSFNALQLAWAIGTYDNGSFNPPTVAFSGPPVSTSYYTWYNTNQTVSWTVTAHGNGARPANGVAGFSQAWDAYFSDPTSEATQGTGNSFYSGPQFPNATSGYLLLANAGQGCHFADVDAWDNTGFTSGDQYYYWICYDTVAPTISVSNSPAANSNGWNNSTVTVTLTAADPGGSAASGIYRTYYAINSGTCYPGSVSTCSIYTAPFTMSAQGESYIYYFTEDNAGNFSPEPYEYVDIDETAPVTTASLSGTLNGSVYNSAVQVTLNATDNLSGVQTTYYQLDGGSSTTYTGAFNVTALGSHIVKYHSVDKAGNTESTKTATFTTSQAAQTITFANPGTQTYGTPLTLTATASSGLAVGYTSLTLPVCTVSGHTVTFVMPGTCTIQATQPGSTYIAAATPVSRSFTVNHATQTITFPAIPATTLLTGSITLSPAPTASSGLPVTIVSDTTAVCTVSGTTVTLVAVGTCGLKATQGGNAYYYGATAAYQNFKVTLATQTITFANPGTQTYGTPLKLSATASSGLAVSYASTTTPVCTVSGTTVSFVKTGSCTIEATQAGNKDYAAATAVSQSFTVNRATQTITFPAIPATTLVTGSVTLAATASSGLPVSYSVSTPLVCTVSGTTVTLVAVGTCGLKATQGGNADYYGATAAYQNFKVTLATQTITFTNPGTQSYGIPLKLTATASSGLAVSYTSTTTPVCTVSGNTVSFVEPGSCTIKATQAGNADYAAAPAVSQNFTVNHEAQTITFPAIPATSLSAGTVTLTATASSGLPVSYSSSTTSVCTVSGSTVTLVAVGNCGLKATQSGNADYYAAPAAYQHFTVTK